MSKLGTVSCGYLEAAIVAPNRVVYMGKGMSLADFISLAEQTALIVRCSEIAAKSIAERYNAYHASSRNPMPYKLWRKPTDLALLVCVLGKKPLPPPENPAFVNGADDIVTELEDELETSLRSTSEVLQEYAAISAAFYDKCVSEILQRKKKQKVDE